MQTESLSRFDPLVARWFRQCFDTPTQIQVGAWQAISRGNHLLMTAPTGSGKTMAAFLWALDQLISGRWEPGSTHVLYVSPLKALNNDIQRNLWTPLSQLQELFKQHQRPFPSIRVDTRSGDTPPADRRRMLRRPPEILITTPESLNLLLSSAGGRSLLGRLKTVILDEIHAILPSRRGTHLITAVERLVLLSGEFQRIALSATITPLDRAAAFVGGFRLEGSRTQPRYVARNVTVLTTQAGKQYQLAVRRPKVPETPRGPNEFWAVFADRISGHLQANRSTLVFTNSRRLCEKLTYLINHQTGRNQTELLAYSHHGSLSKEIRAQVEKNLKAGQLKAIVATGSLELGIDIGALDEVIVVQSPWSVAEAVQRVGRAGHGVGQTSRATFYAAHTLDLVSSAVVAKAIDTESIEASLPMQAPLDVLAQVLLSMVSVEPWHPQDLYNRVRTAAPYAELTRRCFDLVLEMLEGRYQETRLRELHPKLSHDRLDQRLTLKKGALLALYTSGGVIPNRGYYGLRHAGTMAKIGELDEEFVWEARIGQEFTLGAQNWRIRQITHSDVLVVPAASGKPTPPFWRAEDSQRSFHLSEKILNFMEMVDVRLTDPGLESELVQRYHLDADSARLMIEELIRQRVHTGCGLPHRHHLVVEDTTLGAGSSSNRQVIWHTLWGGRINRPLAIALEAAWEERYATTPQIFATNDTLIFLLPPDLPAKELLSLVRSDRVDDLLRRRLAQSGFFGARFRECAGRALLLPRRHPQQRMPLWLTRLRAQKLMAAVAAYPDFPILIETWRTCLQDEFDLPGLRRLLEEIETATIGWSYARTPFPSPLARASAWQQVNQHMYQGDSPAPEGGGRIAADLLHEVALEPGLRPRIEPELVRRFEAKRQRLAPGYAPESPPELLDWVKERVVLPVEEWQALLNASVLDHRLDQQSLVACLADKLVLIHPTESDRPTLICACELLPRLLHTLYSQSHSPLRCTLMTGQALDITLPEFDHQAPVDESDDPTSAVFGQWLRFYGPRASHTIAALLGLPAARLTPILAELAASQTIIIGALTVGGDPEECCDRENFETLMRMSRKAASPHFSPLAIERLPLFLANYQGIAPAGGNSEELAWRINQLLGWAAPAGIWEKEILPARLVGYQSEWLDRLVQANELRWIGVAGFKTFFCLGDELDLIDRAPPPGAATGSPGPKALSKEETDESVLFPEGNGRYPFSVLQPMTALPAARLNEWLWRKVWAGCVTNDSFAALRRGVQTNFKLVDGAVDHPYGASTQPNRRALGRSSFQRWRETRPSVGNWFRLDYPEPIEDLIELEERNKERVRLLLDRYGLVFRELLARELPQLRWGALFRSLRLMELAGEVLAGCFFNGISGLQFISPQALQHLSQPCPDDAVFWLNGVDPASLCGLGIEPLQSQLPKRLPGVHLVYHGANLVIISHQQAKRLEIGVPADHPRLADYFCFLTHLLSRAFMPLRSIQIETINGTPTQDQPGYRAVLATLFETTADPKGITLYRRHDA